MASSIRLSYSRRLFYWLLVYSLLLVGCFIIYQYTREKEFKVSELNSRLQQINTYIGRELAAGVPIDSVRLDLLHADSNIRVPARRATATPHAATARAPETPISIPPPGCPTAWWCAAQCPTPPR